MLLNLAEKNPSRLLATLQSGFAEAKRDVLIELLGPGLMLHDTALMLYHALRARPRGLRVHVHSHTCLIDGAMLFWLAGESRSIRPDAWIQVSLSDHLRSARQTTSVDYPTAIRAFEEAPSETDLRTIHGLLNEYVPVSEISGLRLFESDLHDLGLIRDRGQIDPLEPFFKMDAEAPADIDPPEGQRRSARSKRQAG